MSEDSSSRKLIKWGSSRTLIISLPRKWVKRNNLQAEQEIKAIENSDGSLTLIPREVNEFTDITSTLEIKDESDLESIWLKLNTKYLDGCDVIKLTTKKEFSRQIRLQIEQIIAPLLGLEILGASQKEIIIKDVMAIGTSNILSLVRMIGDNTIELSDLFTKITEVVGERSFIDPQIIRKSIQKYYFRIQRELRKALYQPLILSKMSISMQNVLDISFFITNVNDIAENVSLLISTIKNSTLTFTNQFGELDFFKKVNRVIKNSIESFLFKNSITAIEQIKIIDNLKKTRFKIEKDVINSTDSIFSLPIIIELISKILDQTRIISYSALRMAI